MKNQHTIEIPANVFRAIFFSQPLSMRYLNEFFSVPEFIYASLTTDDVKFLEQKGKDGVSQVLSRLERSMMSSIQVVDLTASETTLPSPFDTWAQAIFATEIDASLAVHVGLSGTYNLLVKSNRTTVQNVNQVQLLVNSNILLRSPFQFYWEEKYSIAYKGQDVSYALYTASAEGGGKGSARLLIKIWTHTELLIDDASKYIDVTPFLKGVNI
mgnify:CR=1 FL=1